MMMDLLLERSRNIGFTFIIVPKDGTRLTGTLMSLMMVSYRAVSRVVLLLPIFLWKFGTVPGFFSVPNSVQFGTKKKFGTKLAEIWYQID